MTFGHVITDECARLGIALDDYIAAYDPRDVAPFDGVAELLGDVGRWAIASHKDRAMGLAEIAAFGWSPEAAFFTQDFGGAKRLDVVLSALGIGGDDALFVGDTSHDRDAALSAGVRFVVAGWNARADVRDGDVVARHPRRHPRPLAALTARAGRGGGGMARPPIITRGAFGRAPRPAA